jgi:hypothetical protein
VIAMIENQSSSRVVVLPERQLVVDGIPFRLELAPRAFQEAWYCTDASVVEAGVEYRCRFPRFPGYYRDGCRWARFDSDSLEEVYSSAIIRQGRSSAVQFTSGYSSRAIRIDKIDSRLFKMIFLWERDLNSRPRCFYHLGAFHEWIEQRLDAGEVISHDKPFFFQDWQQHGPHNERFQRERQRRERRLKAGDRYAFITPV